MRKFTLLLIAFTGALCIASNAQTIYCPPNVDFELGDYSNWQFYVGSCCTGGGLGTMNITLPVSTPPSSAYIPCAFALTGPAPATGSVALTGIDPFGGFPVVAAGVYSLRIGSQRTMNWAEKAEYYVHVPAGTTNYGLIYRYAAVLEDPGHPPSQQPRFDITATDSATGTILPCANVNYVSGSLPSFTGPVSNAFAPITASCSNTAAAAVSGHTTNTYYRPWTTATVNLSGYSGHTIIMSFAAGDCQPSGHFGYAYIDMSCGLYAISLTAGCTDTTVTFVAPPGFSSYAWYDSGSYSVLYGVTDTLIIPLPAVSPVTFAVIVSPYPGFGCPDTLYATYYYTYGAPPPISGVTSVCVGNTTTLSSSVTGGTWSPGAGTSIATVSGTGVVTGVAAGTAGITYSLPGGCTSIETVTVTACTTGLPVAGNTHNITVYPNPGNTILNISATENITSITITNILGQTVYSHKHNSSQVQVDISGLPDGTYFVKVNDGEARKFVKE